MLELIKKGYVFAIAFFAIISVPVGLNYLIPLKNNYFTIFGSEQTWFSFWSSYSGAVISGLITLIVLYKTLKQNQKNHIEQKNYSDKLNREQKNFQLKIVEVQNKQNWLVELKKKLKEDIEILDYSNIESLINKIEDTSVAAAARSAIR